MQEEGAWNIPVANQGLFLPPSVPGRCSKRAPNLISLKDFPELMLDKRLDSRTHLLHHTSGFGDTPNSHWCRAGWKTLFQYSFDRSSFRQKFACQLCDAVT